MPPKKARTLLANPVPNHYFSLPVFKGVGFWESCPQPEGTEGPRGPRRVPEFNGGWVVPAHSGSSCVSGCDKPPKQTIAQRQTCLLPPVINSFPCRAGLL